MGDSGAGTGIQSCSSEADPSADRFPPEIRQVASARRMASPAPVVEKTGSGRSAEETPASDTVPREGFQKAGENRKSPDAVPRRNRSRDGSHRNSPVHSHDTVSSSSGTGGYPATPTVTPVRRTPIGKRRRASRASIRTPCRPRAGRTAESRKSSGMVIATATARTARKRRVPRAGAAHRPRGIRLPGNGLPRCLPQREQGRGEEEDRDAGDPARLAAPRVVDHRATGLRRGGRGIRYGGNARDVQVPAAKDF